MCFGMPILQSLVTVRGCQLLEIFYASDHVGGLIRRAVMGKPVCQKQIKGLASKNTELQSKMQSVECYPFFIHDDKTI
jgi:hypothetical protein